MSFILKPSMKSSTTNSFGATISIPRRISSARALLSVLVGGGTNLPRRMSPTHSSMRNSTAASTTARMCRWRRNLRLRPMPRRGCGMSVLFSAATVSSLRVAPIPISPTREAGLLDTEYSMSVCSTSRPLRRSRDSSSARPSTIFSTGAMPIALRARRRRTRFTTPRPAAASC